MNVTFEKTGNLEGQIKVAVSAEDYGSKVTDQLKEIGKKRDIPGFRKGHVPMPQLIKMFGKQVKSDIINDVVYKAVVDYIKENNLDLLGQPLPENVQEIKMDQKDYEFTYAVGLAPEVNITLDKSVTLPYYNIEVTDEMVNEQLDSILTQVGERANVEEYEDRAIVKGAIKQVAPAEGEEAVVVEDGIIGPFTFASEDEKAKFNGKKVGETVVFNPWTATNGNEAEIASMLHLDRADVAKGNGDYEMTIKEMIAPRKAELNEETLGKLLPEGEEKTEENLRKKIRESIAMQLAPNSAQMFQRNAEDYLMDTYAKDMELPEAFLKRFIAFTEPGEDEADIDANLKHSLPGIKWEIIENRVSEKFEVKVSKEDVDAYARRYAMGQLQQYGMAGINDELVKYYTEQLMSDEKFRNRITRQAYSDKMFGSIHGAVTLDEKTVSMEKFREMVSELNKSDDAAEQVAEA